MRTERLYAWFVSLFGAGIAVVAAYALLAEPVNSVEVAAVRAVALLAGASVAAGGLLVVRGRLPAQPVAPFSVAPASLAGAAVVLSTEDVSPWIHAAAALAVACGVLGFALVAASVAADNT